jgi:hypothetical protein
VLRQGDGTRTGLYIRRIVTVPPSIGKRSQTVPDGHMRPDEAAILVHRPRLTHPVGYDAQRVGPDAVGFS